MESMTAPGEDNCPFEFNFDAETFKVGDLISYRVEGSMMDMPFVGTLTRVEADYVMLKHYDPSNEGGNEMRGTRESRPVVSEADALA